MTTLAADFQAPTAHASGLAGGVGREGVSGLQIQNQHHSETATIGAGLLRSGPMYQFGTSKLAAPMRAANLQLGYLTGPDDYLLQVDLGSDERFAHLPSGFLGTAWITSDVPMAVATHVDLTRSPMSVYGFEGVSVGHAASRVYARLFGREYVQTAEIAEGSTTVALPLFRKGHMPRHNFMTTGIQVINIGDDVARARITCFGSEGTEIPSGDLARLSIQPLSAHTWCPPDILAPFLLRELDLVPPPGSP